MKRVLLTVLIIGVLLLNACGAPTTAPEAEVPPTEETTPEAGATLTPPPTEETALEVEATPTPTTHTLSVTVSPSEAGSVSPSGGQYEEGTQLILTATPTSSYFFDYWSGDATGSLPTITVIMDSDKSAIAHFEILPVTYRLDISISPSGAGSVSPSSGEYAEGTQVTLTAVPVSGYAFDYWGGDASGSSPTTTIIMDSDKSVTAHFADTTPPVISGVGISGIMESRAIITWETDELATSQVEYGTTNAYGSTMSLNEELTTSHSVTLTELKPETTYHSRVKSVDEAGNEALSDDCTFTTKTTKELLSPMLYSGITIGGRVHQLSFNLFNGSSQTITVAKVEIFNEYGDVAFTMSKSDIAETWGSGEVGVGKSLSAGISFGIPPSTKEIEDWQVKWYCLDADGQRFTVKGLTRKL